MIEERLLKHFRREVYTTAIYVLNFPRLAYDRPYSYLGTHPGCQQSAFIGRGADGIAWVDLHAGADWLEPAQASGAGYLPPPEPDAGEDVYRLGSFVHRSMEALVPSPQVRSGDLSLHEALHFTLITVCNVGLDADSAGQPCTDDADGAAAVSSLVSSLHSGFRRVTSEKVSIDAVSDPGMALAIQAATRTSGTDTFLDASTLAKWLPGSDPVAQVLQRDAQSVLYAGLVVVVLQLHPGAQEGAAPRGFGGAGAPVEAFKTEAIRLDFAPVGYDYRSAGDDAAIVLAERRLDVFETLLVAKPADGSRVALHPDSEIMCDRRPLVPSAAYLARQLRSQLLHLLWRDCEDGKYYSTSSRQVDMDCSGDRGHESRLHGGFLI